ncbi:hypothetical protein [Anoxybacteroides tepidamans]|uniref:hypothetical protein n=1 Tax=Anoxybacteroides tepidamans TaxID=265948 RepID=UPI000688CB93|nr:hypothetical protein [Anoxybacillus tepidamans]
MEEKKGKKEKKRYTLHSWESALKNRSEERVNSQNVSDSRALDENQIKIKNGSISSIGQSGNSDVDIHLNVHVDTTAIAFAILCSLLATKQMNIGEFNEAVRKLEHLIKRRDSFIIHSQ